jgi:hypothetical protein
MDNLSAPSRELVLLISREVDFKDRLIGSNLHERAGVKTISLYSLHELYMLLNKPYPQIDLNKIEHWVRMVIKDEELAERIKMVIGQPENDFDKLLQIRDLVGVRLTQCRAQDESILQKDVITM